MSAPLMVTISGIRGIAGKSFTPSVVMKYVAAFGVMQAGKKIVLGMDSRVSGPWVQRLVQGLLMSLGYDVLDIGIVPTPTVQFIVQQEKADGGIVITSSHNPVEWNGLKFIDSDGLFVAPAKCDTLFALAEKWEESAGQMLKAAGGVLTLCDTACQRHIDAIASLPFINVDQVKARKFTVCLDTVNGAGGPIMKALLERFGCTVIPMNYDTTGVFSHMPEPIPEHLGDLCDAVKKNKADFGVATDPDVDRCVLIDETGKPIGEEYTLAFAVKFMLGHVGRRGPVVKNLSSSRVNDDIAKEYGCEMVNTPVGEIQVAKVMEEVKAVIGGEGNGGVMLPDLHIGRDAPVAAALALQLLAIHGGTLSALKASLPLYEIVKLKAPIEGIDPDAVVEHFRKKWEGKAVLNDADGLRIDAEGWWVHLRKSNTEPIIRVIGEGGNYDQSMQRCKEFLEEIVALGKK